MKIKVKIIPDDGPNEAHEFGSPYEAAKFIYPNLDYPPQEDGIRISLEESEWTGKREVLNRDEEAAEMLTNGFKTSYTHDKIESAGIENGPVAASASKQIINAATTNYMFRSGELSPVEPERPGFIKRLFGVR